MIVIVTGSRHDQHALDEDRVKNQMVLLSRNRHPDEMHLFVGGARGVDRIATLFARGLKWNLHEYPYIQRLGKQGGPMRNRIMVQDAKWFAEQGHELIEGLAFPGPNSRGTTHCISVMKDFDIPVMISRVES